MFLFCTFLPDNSDDLPPKAISDVACGKVIHDNVQPENQACNTDSATVHTDTGSSETGMLIFYFFILSWKIKLQ